ncbi:MAG: hypothetical protein ACXWXW_00830 [Bacteroidia bacterium]
MTKLKPKNKPEPAPTDKYKFKFVYYLNQLPFLERASVNKEMPELLGIGITTYQKYLYMPIESEQDVKGEVLRRFAVRMSELLNMPISVDDLYNYRLPEEEAEKLDAKDLGLIIL